MRRCALLLVLVCGWLGARADTIYAALANGDILAVDSEQMSSTVVAHTAKSWYDIALAADGRLYGSDGGGLYRIDLHTGGTSRIGDFGSFINGMDFVGDTLYGSGNLWLYAIDLGSGHARMVGSNLAYASSGDLEWYGEKLYMSAEGTWGDKLLWWDLESGRPVLVGAIGYHWVYGLAATSAGMLAFTARGEVLSIDLSTGAGTRVGSVPGVVNGASTLPQPGEVAEPATLLLLGTGLAAAGRKLRGQ